MKVIVKVIPNSKEIKIQKEPDGSIRINLKSPAKEGKANKELTEALADYFNVAKSVIHIKVGLKSRDKIIIIDKD